MNIIQTKVIDELFFLFFINYFIIIFIFYLDIFNDIFIILFNKYLYLKILFIIFLFAVPKKKSTIKKKIKKNLILSDIFKKYIFKLIK